MTPSSFSSRPSGGGLISAVVLSLALVAGAQDARAQYCSAGSTSCQALLDEEVIARVVFNTIDNTSNPVSAPTGCYSDFTSISTSVNPNQTYFISVQNTGLNGVGDKGAAWFDWNQNGVFDPSEQVTLVGDQTGAEFTANVIVPNNAVVGPTRMRIRLTYWFGNRFLSPCGNATYGEVEDYTVNVLPPTLGACCDATSGACDLLSSFDCTVGFQGAGTVCAPNPCGGACCAVDGTCTVARAAACGNPNIYIEGAVCGPNPCRQPGACCPTGSTMCVVSQGANCAGSFKGDLSSCSPNPCLGVCNSYVIAAGPGTYVTGTTDIGNHSNSGAEPTTITLPFPVSVYGSSYSVVNVYSGGFIEFATATSNLTVENICLPVPNITGPALFAFHSSQMRTDYVDCGIYTASVQALGIQAFVIQWTVQRQANPGGIYNFEVIFYQDQSYFDVVYGDFPSGNRVGHVGVQASSAGPFTQFECNTTPFASAVQSGVSLRFSCDQGSDLGACCNAGACTVTTAANCPSALMPNTSCSSNPCHHGPQYCSAGSTSCQASFSEEVITRVVFNTIDNPSSDVSGPGGCYSDFTAISTSVEPNQPYTLTVHNASENGPEDQTTVWFDWNRNAVFDPGERVLLEGDGTGTLFTASVVVPNDAVPGLTGMRVRATYIDYELLPCGTAEVGEVEDYTVMVLPATRGACCNATSGTCALTTPGECAAGHQGVGTSCAPNPCGGACCNGATCSVSIAASCVYPAVYFNHAVCSPNPCQYCAAGAADCGDNNADSLISRVAFGSAFDNRTPNNGRGGCYSDFTGMTAFVAPGQSSPITVWNPHPNVGEDQAAVWVDWNRNYALDAGEQVTLSANAASTVFTGNVLAPTTAVLGPTRMRVRMAQSDFTMSSCGSSTSGEVEDYTVMTGLFGVGVVAVSDSTGNGNSNGAAEPGESSVALSIPLVRGSPGGSTGIAAALMSLTPTVTVASSASGYLDLAAGATGSNLTPFVVSIAPAHPCGAPMTLQLSMSADSGQTTAGFTLRVPVGTVSAAPAFVLSRSGVNAAIPDNNPAGVSVPYVVSGVTGQVTGVRFRFDGNSNNSPTNANTGLGHAAVGQLIVTLTSPPSAAHPQGITVTLANQPGSPEPSTSNNFGLLSFDDFASSSIQAIGSENLPVQGAFSPASPLSALNSLTAAEVNGTWMVKAADVVANTGGIAGGQGGTFRRASLIIDTVAPACSAPQASSTCCRGTTCLSVSAGSCTGTVAGSASVAVGSCGAGTTLATCCYADYDHSGTSTIDDLFIYINLWLTASPYTRIGGNGTAAPSIDDLFVFINLWLAGCS